MTNIINKVKGMSRFTAVMLVVIFFMLASLAAFAVYLYKSVQRVNNFTEGKTNVQVIENDSSTDSGTAVFTWAKENPLEEDSPYSVKKEIRAISQYDGQYIRVKLVPSWRDESGNICAPDYISDLSYAGVEDGSFVFKRTESAAPTITCVLADNYSDYWEYDDQVQCFVYKTLVPKDKKTEPLVKSVRIDSTTYSYTTDSLTGAKYDLYLDALVDSVEKYGGAKENRWGAE